ncbi:phosphoesterase [Cohnella terricola]|uniref:Phosphoesterase n=1 Tax=Cohnella terricola TaxID=1289167 RepID=A0A559JTY9_9BACL|nr:phosphoesterase [Cohnella terricola]
MVISNPYDKQGIWLKGSFHNHTTNSACGSQPLETVYRMYGQYDFLGISDHDFITAHEGERSIPSVYEALEVSSPLRHMLLINPPRSIMDDYSNAFSIERYQQLSDLCTRYGGMSVLVHPNRYYSQFWPIEDMLAMNDYTGIEVINGEGNPEYDIAFDKWDALLSAERKVWGFGGDDFHVYGQEKRAWNMVLAEQNTNASILTAMKAGSFYISTGYGFKSIRTEGGTITFNLLSSEGLDRMYKYITLIGRDGNILYETSGRINSVSYNCRGDEGYVRAAAYLEGGFGAFSQPLFIV